MPRAARLTLAAVFASCLLGALPGTSVAAGKKAAVGPFDTAINIVSDPAELARRAPEAEKLFAAVVKADPKNVDALYNLGLLAYRRGDFAAARQRWKQALAVKADFFPAKARLLWLDGAKNPKAVQPKLEAIVKADRFQPEARNLLAQIAIQDKKWDVAIKNARNVLLGDPDNINAYLNLAVAYYRQGLPEQAGLIASNALERQPKAAALHNMMGLVYLSRDDSRHASEEFVKALKIDPSQIDARVNLGSLELAYGDFKTALSRFDQVLKLGKDAGQQPDPMVVLSRAVTLRGLQRYADAEQGYREALRLDPGMDEARYNLCVLYHQYKTKGEDRAKWMEAKKVCEDYLHRIKRKHPKYREIRKRIRSIDKTLKVLTPAEPTPAASGAGAKP